MPRSKSNTSDPREIAGALRGLADWIEIDGSADPPSNSTFDRAAKLKKLIANCEQTGKGTDALSAAEKLANDVLFHGQPYPVILVAKIEARRGGQKLPAIPRPDVLRKLADNISPNKVIAGERIAQEAQGENIFPTGLNGIDSDIEIIARRIHADGPSPKRTSIAREFYRDDPHCEARVEEALKRIRAFECARPRPRIVLPKKRSKRSSS